MKRYAAFYTNALDSVGYVVPSIESMAYSKNPGVNTLTTFLKDHWSVINTAIALANGDKHQDRFVFLLEKDE
jgi:hypothetical protein